MGGVDTGVGKWNPPECPFRIEYSARMLDEIRLAVVDAFFSLPRGGAEIGGILLGSHQGDVIQITAYEQLDCEHALGPSFVLSPRDQLRLSDMTARAARNHPDRQLLGWYHSHTRSEIFLSETDQDIHNRFFWEPWQVALVLKPHTFEPTRGGFFFREANGSIRGDATYREFVLEPLPVRPAPVESASPSPAYRSLIQEQPARIPAVTIPPPPSSSTAIAAPVVPVPPPSVDAVPSAALAPSGKRVPITREIPAPFTAPEPEEAPPEAEPAPAVTQEEAPTVYEPAPPQFLQLKPERDWRGLKVAACLALGLALGVGGYQTRDSWLPRILAKIRPAPPKELTPYLSLSIADSNGQLEIRWDRNSPAVRKALDATLQIDDGSMQPQVVHFDGAHLAGGALSYGRQSEHVDVVMTATEPGGATVKEQASFLGKMPVSKAPAEDAELRQQRDALAEKADQLQKDLESATSKNRKLEKDLKDAHDRLEQEQRRRLGAQTGGKQN